MPQVIKSHGHMISEDFLGRTTPKEKVKELDNSLASATKVG